MDSTIKPRGIVVFSGGSAANNLVDVFKSVRENKKCPLSYVIPISDNGGSSSELIRVFGGPGIGDVRSRLVRLIPSDPDHDDSEKSAIKTFFNHRLPKDRVLAKQEWFAIVEAEHPLWEHISSAKKELIRSFLNLVNFEIAKRKRPSSTFNFEAASIGNLFLTGARLFSGSFESAIYLLSSICSVPSHTSVLPAINTNFTHHISAGLANGTIITGQNSISHPTTPSLPTQTLQPHEPPSTATSPAPSVSVTPSSTPQIRPSDNNKDAHNGNQNNTTKKQQAVNSQPTADDEPEDANPPGTHPTLRAPAISFSKTTSALPARINRIWYINPYGAEIRLTANPRVISALLNADAVVYSIGSLYTSIVPSLILKGVGDALRDEKIRYKILILNAVNDRETGAGSDAPYSAMDFVGAVVKAANESRGVEGGVGREEWREYVTHIVHLVGEGTPVVEREELAGLGIECVRVYGRRVEGEEYVRYDERALVQALEVVMGGVDPRLVKSRRNTLEN